MKKQLLTFIGALFLTIGFVSCNSNTPKETAEKFLNAFYHMDYDGAKSLATNDSKATIDLFAQFATAMMSDSMKAEAKKIKIEIKDEKIEGDKATITYTTSEDGNKLERKLNLIKQGEGEKKDNGKWLVAWSKQDSMTDTEGENEQGISEPAPTENGSVDTLVAPPVDSTQHPSSN
ncbi:MAG TPA: DUF4878 domain-containing protein [Flavipsychrobacter sp.]|jgi:hypothetical protein|nr:DUF4878 domain-containing protein [Flavipsychrobacter sp.]